MGGKFLKYAISKAQSGKPWLFGRIMQEVIPFNRPHRISVVEISAKGCKVFLPDRRRNRNHLGNMHACAIATAAEYVSGLNIVEACDLSKFRLIMSKIVVDYIRRPNGSCIAESSLSKSDLSLINKGLNAEGVAKFAMVSTVTDSKKNEIVAKATIHWQVKSWKKVLVK